MPAQPGQPTPQWQPSGKIFLVGTMIDGMRQGAQEQYATLLEVRPTPHVLDDYTVGRIVAVYTEQRDDLWLWDEQLREVATSILTLADELKRGTIETVLAKDDGELGLEMLLRQLGERES